jgi:hypothetical protein
MLLKLIFCTLIIALFLYSKLLPHKDKLDLKYKKIFGFFQRFFEPILNFFIKIIKPVQVGSGLSVDVSQIVLLVILLIFI